MVNARRFIVASRQSGHFGPVDSMVIGRPLVGAFLCNQVSVDKCADGSADRGNAVARFDRYGLLAYKTIPTSLVVVDGLQYGFLHRSRNLAG